MLKSPWLVIDKVCLLGDSRGGKHLRRMIISHYPPGGKSLTPKVARYASFKAEKASLQNDKTMRM